MSWEPLDLRYLPERPPAEVALEGLGYYGRRHGWHGPPEAGKTIVGYLVLLEEARRGNKVLVVDFEMGPHDARDRFLDLGATDDDLERILFVEPDTPADASTIGSLADRWEPTIVLFDSSAGAFGLHGADDNKRQDTERVAGLLVDPLRDRGRASVVLDHVVKNSAERGRWAVGSERKIGGVDVALSFDAKIALSRGRRGLIVVSVSKDRLGHLHRPKLAEIELVSDPVTHRIAWTFQNVTDGVGDRWRPTHLMGLVSQFLAKQTEPVSRAEVERQKFGGNDYVRTAMDELVAEGYAREHTGPRKARLLQHLKTYDLATSPDLAATSPSAMSNDLATSPPSYRDGGVEVRDGVQTGSHLAGPIIGDPGFLETLYAAFEAGHVTEGEWVQASAAHRLVGEGAA